MVYAIKFYRRQKVRSVSFGNVANYRKFQVDYRKFTLTKYYSDEN